MKKRMRDYGKEGIQHFYFMMLQKDEVRLGCRLLFTSAKMERATCSSSMQLRKAGSGDSQTTVATLIATLQNGPSGTECEWGYLPRGPY